MSFADSSGRPLDISEKDFDLRAWQAWFPWDEPRATTFDTSSKDLDRVWQLNQNSVKTLTIDLYTDSNARQRSPDCQADAAVAAQAQFATSAELGLPKFMMEQIMNFAHTKEPWPYVALPPPFCKHYLD